MTNFGITSPEGQERIVGVAVSPGAAASTVLTADGAGGTSWAAGGGSQPIPSGVAAADLGGGFVPGFMPACGVWGLAGDIGGTSGASWPDTFGATGSDFFMPWFIPDPVTPTKLCWQVTPSFGATGTYRLGLYKADESWQPTELLFDSGDQDGTVDTPLSAAFTSELQGRYLSVLCADADYYSNGVPTIGLQIGAAGGLAIGSGYPTQDGTIAGIVSFAPCIVSRTRAFGAFPDPGSRWDTVNIDASQFGVTNGLCVPLWAQIA